MTQYILNQDKTMRIDLETGHVDMVGDWGYDDLFDKGVVDDAYFRGIATRVKKYNTNKAKEVQLRDKLTEVQKQLRQVSDNSTQLKNDIKAQVRKNFSRISGFTPSRAILDDLDALVYHHLSRAFPSKTVDSSGVELESVKYPRDGELGGAIYTEYDRTTGVFDDLADAYIIKHYSREIAAVGKIVTDLNKKLPGFDFVVSKRMDVGDKYVYVMLDIRYTAPKLVKSTVAKKVHKLVTTLTGGV